MIEYLSLPSGLRASALTATITNIVIKRGSDIVHLSFNFVSGDALLELNKRHLAHEYETDILTFDYGTPNKIEAEVFISTKATEEAPIRFSETVENESIRLIAHGLYHCLGYTDKTEEEKVQMRILENEFIARFHVKQKKYV